MKREHGLHNQAVCNKLELDDMECNDWVVTTAFYASIHFIDHALFPCVYNGERFDNINQAHNFISSNSKHQTRGYLLNKIMPKHASDYEFLIEKCHNARYSNYQVNPAISDRAVSNLRKIMNSYNKEKSELESLV